MPNPKIISEIIKNEPVVNIIAKAFELGYKDANLHLIMAPLDNNPTLSSYIIRAHTFASLIEDMQAKYSIYNHGYNLYRDGNCIYLINKASPNNINYKDKKTFTFVTVSMVGHSFIAAQPIKIDKEEKNIEMVIDSQNVRFYGDFTDGSLSEIVTINSEGTISEPTIVSTVKDIKMNESSKNNHDAPKDTTNYNIVVILIPNSFLTFVPGDEIVIKKQAEPNFVWKGTVKRWAAEQVRWNRSVIAVCVGKEDTKTGSSGNKDLKDKTEEKSELSILASKAEALGEVAKNVGKALNKSKDVLDDVAKAKKKLGKDLANLPDNIVKEALTGIGDLGSTLLAAGIDKTLGKDAFNEILNTYNAVIDSPVAKAILNRDTITRIGASLGLDMTGILSALTTLGLIKDNHPFRKSFGYNRGQGIYNPDLFFRFKQEYFYEGDGYDIEANKMILKDILKDTGVWEEVAKKFNLTPIEKVSVKNLLLSTIKHGAPARFKDPYKALNKIYKAMRDLAVKKIGPKPQQNKKLETTSDVVFASSSSDNKKENNNSGIELVSKSTEKGPNNSTTIVEKVNVPQGTVFTFDKSDTVTVGEIKMTKEMYEAALVSANKKAGGN